jgi:hypothetical protein
MAEAAELEDFLEHYGIPGMKWGKRKGPSDGPSRKELRTMDKTNRAADRSKFKATQAKEVDKARERFQSGQARKDYLDAKATYKIDKARVGKYEANKAFQKVKDRNIKDAEKANEVRDGKELAKVVLVGAAVVTLKAIVEAQRA